LRFRARTVAILKMYTNSPLIAHGLSLITISPLLAGYLLDLLFGDPEGLPHPVRGYGYLIAKGEERLNQGNYRFLKGAGMTVLFSLAVFAFFFALEKALFALHPLVSMGFNAVMVFLGLANQGLIREGKQVFEVLDQQGLEAGRKQLSRIVGRDTGQLTPQQVRIGALESMSENLSDGIIAPLFFYALAGVSGMMAYKMVNTLDSMIGYRNERYEQFGKFAARLDDLLNWIPARLTVLLMSVASLSWRGLAFAYQYGGNHKSPNSGYPEATLAGILDCRFGGPNRYHGAWVDKPYIGVNERLIAHKEISQVARINHLSCFLMILLVLSLRFIMN
jgi:adenosylcobinamide-phosphate synthase